MFFDKLQADFGPLSRKTGSKNHAKAKTFGVDLAKVSDKFGELEQSLFGNQSKLAFATC